MNEFVLIFFSITFLATLAFLASITGPTAEFIGIRIENITCPMPSYQNDTAYDQDCSGIHNTQAYEDETTFSIPTGFLHWIGDTFHVVGVKIFVIFELIGTAITPPTTLLGFDLESALVVVWPIYIGIYIALAIGIYKVLSPFS